MSFIRTSLANMREQGTLPWFPLLVGLILGLLLGLIVGWVVWPVEWQGAHLGDLTPAMRAEYVSAVADSYVVYSSDAARVQALRRLENLQSDLLSELQSAMSYYRSQPTQENEIRLYNLAQLANALGGQANPALAQVSTPAGEIVIAATGNEAVAVVPETQANLAIAATNNSAGTSNWLSWLLTLFAGILFIGGGLYLLQKLRQGGGLLATDNPRVVGGRPNLEESYSFEDESEFSETIRADTSTASAPWVSGEQERSPSTSKSSVKQERAPWESLADDATLDRENPSSGYGRTSESPNKRFPSTTQPPPSPDNRPRPSFPDEDAEDFEQEETMIRRHQLDDEVEFDEDDEVDAPAYYPPAQHSSYPLQNRAVQSNHYLEDGEEELADDDELLDEADDVEDEIAPTKPRPTAYPLQGSSSSARHRSYEENPPAQFEMRAQPVRPGSAPLTQYSQSKTIGSFECSFYTGMSDYEESFHIADPATNRFIGQCGLGVSTKNRILQKNPDEVLAFELWLFDKGDGANMNTQMRILMSEYASDHYQDMFSKERNGDARPFVPQPGVNFQLEGPTLLLNGKVVEATYNREGIFQSLKIQMNVLRR